MDPTTRLELRQRLRTIVEPTVRADGCELVAIEVTGDSYGRIVRLFVDKAGGVTIDDCARISRAVSPEFDVEDPIEGEYRLEVSSPGIDRPVETVEDFQRFVGFRVKVRLIVGGPRRRFTGEIVSADEDTVRICMDGIDHDLSFGQIDQAHLILDLDQFNALQTASAESTTDSPNPNPGDRP